ncbi:hypothetical protein V6Z12_D04G136500 [Gossypium hirsutum]
MATETLDDKKPEEKKVNDKENEEGKIKKGHDWELRPGVMLVQKRDLDTGRPPIPPSTIRVRVKYKSIYHEIGINSQATFSKSLTLFYRLILKIHSDENLLCLTRDAKSDSVPDLQQQVVGLKVELCRLLEEKRSAVLRSDELETTLMEMVKQDN